MKRLVALCGLLASCGVDVALDPSDVSIVLCSQDDDCPVGFCAPSGRCVTTVDSSPLRLEAATATSPTTVELRFDDAVGDRGDIGNYVVEPALTVIAVDPGSDSSAVVLTIAQQVFDVVYEVTVAGVTDDQGNALASDSASTTFPSFFGLRSDIAPHFTSPGEGAIVSSATITLAWSAVSGASTYFVDIATNAAFTENVQHASTSEQQAVFAVPFDVTYYARVRADVTKLDTYGAVTFDRLNDVIYVACTTDPCGHGGRGTRTAPLTSIAQALTLAVVSTFSEIRVAARPGGLAYDEVLAMTFRGVRLRGGFDAAFSSDTPNPSQPTKVRAISNALTVSDIGPDGNDAVVEAFTFTTSGLTTQAVVVLNTNVVTFDDVVVTAGVPAVSSEATAVFVQDTRGTPRTRLVMRRTTLRADATSSTRGLDLSHVAFELHDVEVASGAATHALGFSATDVPDSADADLSPVSEVDHCTVVVEGGSGSVDAALITNNDPTVASPRIAIHDSTFRATSLATNATGLHVKDLPGTLERTTVQVNSVSSGSALILTSGTPLNVRNVGVSIVATTGVALQIEPGAQNAPPLGPVIADSSFVSGSVAIGAFGSTWSLANSLVVAGAYCVVDQTPNFPASFVGNMLVGPSLYRTFRDGLNQNLTDIADVNALNGAPDCMTPATCPSTRRFAANVTVAAVASDIFVAYGTGTDDLHVKASAPGAVKTGGIDATQASCGPLGQAPITCGGDGQDLNGQTRTGTYTFGCDEL